MGDSDTLGLSSDSSGTESLSWIANSMDWDYKSDETDSETIFSGSKGRVDTIGLVGHNNKDTISNAESVIRNMPVTEDQEVVSDDEMESQGKMFYGGIWWNSICAEDMDLYDDHEYGRCEDDAIMREVDPEEKDLEEDPEEKDPEEDPEEGVHKREASAGDSEDESFTVDFIFSNAAAVFQNCQIRARLPLPNQKNSVTAQGRKDPNQNTGFSLQFCNITADSDLASKVNQTYTYLGRPWKEFSRTVVMQSYLGNAIRPEGWLAWQGDFALNTLYYAEYMNYGPGSGLANRVRWPGYHAISSSSQVVNFTVAQFIDGNLWLPSTGVKYTAGFGMST